MSNMSPTRPARRLAQRKRIVTDSDDDLSSDSHDHNTEDESTPAAKPAVRRPSQVHRSISQTPRSEREERPRRMHSAKPEPRGLDESQTTQTAEKLVAKGRRSIRASRQSNFTLVKEEITSPVTTSTPAIQTQHISPLADITEAANNEKSPASTTECMAPVVIKETAAEKPMDLVIRARERATCEMPTAPVAKARIVLTYLILTNFKSYAGRQEVGPFHSSFSSVVGPNGSGKSNVIDSLLFVFGFRASKMRQGKLSALIHNSASFPDLAYCEVEVRFQEVLDHPNGTAETVPDSTLVISRKAFKNNASKYYINGSESNFTTVTNLLRDRGVDLDHKRFLILQGEVESIAQMKPKATTEHDDGLLEYLEDIIGTSRYKSAIEEFATKADSLNELCLDKNNRVQHVEKERKALEGKKDEALSMIQVENELALKQSALYQVYVAECSENIKVTDEAVERIQVQLQQEVERHKDNEKDITVLKQQHSSEQKQFDKMEQSMQSILKQLAKMEKETVKFEEKKKHLNAKVKKLEKTKSTSHAGAQDASAHLERLVEDTVRNTAAIIDLEIRLKAEEQDLFDIREQLQARTQGFSDDINKKQKSLSPWVQHISEKQAAITLAESELSILRERHQASGRTAQDLQHRLDQIRRAKAEKLAELQDYAREQLEVTNEVEKMQKKLHKLVEAEPETKSRLSSAREKADEARASLSSSVNQGNVLSSLLRLKESGRVSGFHGRLGNLGTIDHKYDVAISTACPALDNLVVDSVEVGHYCIDYLRKNNLGRANFILLDRLNSYDAESVSIPESIPRLFDLVTPREDRFRPAFYSVLQNTLVAQDLEQANRVAYGPKRWRVVTLDGQLIDKSGTMSGGGSAKAKGKMSSKLVADVSKQQVEKFEAAQAVLEDEYQELQKARDLMEATIHEMMSKAPGIETHRQRSLLELDSLEREVVDLERRYTELSVSGQHESLDTNKVVSLEKKIGALLKDIDNLTENASTIEEEINVLQEKIMEVGGVQLRGQKAKVDGLKEQISTLSGEILGSDSMKGKTEQHKRKHEKSFTEADLELANVLAELGSLDTEAEQHNHSTVSVKRQAETTQEELDSKTEILTGLTTQLDERMAEINSMRGAELEKRNLLEENLRHRKESEKRMHYWQDKMDRLTVHNLSDLAEDLPQPSLTAYTRDELMDLDQSTLKAEIAALEETLQNVTIDLSVLSEYRHRVEEVAARSSDLSEAVTLRDAAKRQCEELRRLRLEGFMEGFSAISLRLKEMYQMITMGGNAELELVDSLDPFSEGILFSVMPPKKSWKNISNLSGGEKTLSSLALVFALHHYKPTPLYVMDEIDAALDFRNVSIVASYIKERTKNAQFIVISLRNNMFELASRLVGVYKVNHMTKSVTLENRDYINRAL